MLLTYTNDLGQSISFTNKTQLQLTSILLTDADGLHGLPAEVHVVTQHGQDGATYIDSQLPPREVKLTCKIVKDVIETRLKLLRVFNPKLQGTLTLKRLNFCRKLRCVIDDAPSFSPKGGHTFTVSLQAPNPYWLEEKSTRQEIATWEPMFEWPLDIPGEGISFGERTTNLITNILNPGQAKIGMTLVLAATNDVVNPLIAHVLTYKQMRLKVHLKIGDTVAISTGYGEKEVLIHRAGQAKPINGMIYLDVADPLFEFLQLEPGDNWIRYDAQDGINSLNIMAYYAPGYLEV